MESELSEVLRVEAEVVCSLCLLDLCCAVIGAASPGFSSTSPFALQGVLPWRSLKQSASLDLERGLLGRGVEECSRGTRLTVPSD